MAIEFLNRIFGVQPVKKDIALTRQKRKNKGQKKDEKKEEEGKGKEGENKTGKVDIRI